MENLRDASWRADASVTIVLAEHGQESIPLGVEDGHAKHRRPAFRNFAASLDGGSTVIAPGHLRPSALAALHALKSPPPPTVGGSKTSALASHSDRTPADGSAGLAHRGSCHAHTVNPCPTGAAGGSNLRDHAVRRRNRRRRHSLRRGCNQ
jgi:hypothetical protein